MSDRPDSKNFYYPSGGFLRLDMLPDPEHPPPLLRGHPIGFLVPLLVPLELRYPVVRVSGRDRPMLGAAMPEATVDEDRQTGADEDDVRSASLVRPRREVDTVAKPIREQDPSHGQLRAGVLAPVRPHRFGNAITGRPRAATNGE